MFNKSLSIVILCGGNGTRLFPLSRNELPKQFLPLTIEEKTMFEITLERAKKIEYLRNQYNSHVKKLYHYYRTNWKKYCACYFNCSSFK